jgi:aryl-alcohol dehydrogenase-like predicted oxidoreductase
MTGRRINGQVLFALGTAQLGMNYGVANQHGQPNFDVACEIIKTAVASGCRYLDTAAGYGDAEKRLGRIMNILALPDDLALITKAALKSAGCFVSGDLRTAVQRSIKNLQRTSIWALLLHREDDFAWWKKGLGEELVEVRDAGWVHKLGVSLYSPRYVQQALDVPEMEVFQLPASIFDRRFMKAIANIQADGKCVFLRSVFLQGLALMAADRLPANMRFAASPLNVLDGFCRRHGFTRRQWALDYVRLRCPAAIIVFGAELPGQVAENVQALQRLQATESHCAEWDRLWPAANDEAMCPINWPK